jgi:hypothetical protein
MSPLTWDEIVDEVMKSTIGAVDAEAAVSSLGMASIVVVASREAIIAGRI